LPPAAPLPVVATTKRTNRAPLIVGLLLGALVVTGVIVALMTRSSNRSTSAASSTTAPAAPVPALDAATLAFIEERNPWVTERGVPIQVEAVRRIEYMRYVNALPADQRAAAKPLFVEEIDAGDDTAINWITFEQAERYCKAIGGKLLTDEQWQRLDAATNGGINRGGRRLWTSTKAPSGKAIVRGAFAEMQPDAIRDEKPWRFERDTEATARGRDPLEKVAAKDLGFRCSR
jgi:hypothetical protein